MAARANTVSLKTGLFPGNQIAPIILRTISVSAMYSLALWTCLCGPRNRLVGVAV
jgi:hypothetical protein